jgi:hypothetical protein
MASKPNACSDGSGSAWLLLAAPGRRRPPLLPAPASGLLNGWPHRHARQAPPPRTAPGRVTCTTRFCGG